MRCACEQAQREAAGVLPIRICMGASCIASGARRVQEALVEQIAAQGLSSKAEICEVGCLGPCSGGPVVVIGRRVLRALALAGLRGDRA